MRENNKWCAYDSNLQRSYQNDPKVVSKQLQCGLLCSIGCSVRSAFRHTHGCSKPPWLYMFCWFISSCVPSFIFTKCLLPECFLPVCLACLPVCFLRGLPVYLSKMPLRSFGVRIPTYQHCGSLWRGIYSYAKHKTKQNRYAHS